MIEDLRWVVPPTTTTRAPILQAYDGHSWFTIPTIVLESSPPVDEWSETDYEPDITKCPQCGGEADNGFDRCYPPNPYNCTKCEENDH